MNGRIFYHEQEFYLNQHKLSGVQNIAFNFSNTYSEINVLGVGLLKNYVDSLPEISMSFNRIFVSNDPVYDIFLNSLKENNPLMTGIFLYKDKHFRFQNNFYIKSYELSCSINQYLTSSVSLNNIANYETGYNSEAFYSGLNINNNGSEQLQIPTWQTVFITTNPLINDRIVSFNYSIDLEKTPVYRLGQLSPYAYKTQYPISETFTLEVELDEGSIPEYRDNLCSFKNHDIDIEIKTKCTNDLIRKISRTGLILESFSLNGDIGSNLKVSMIYKNALNEADIFPALSTANSFFASQIITGENAKYINRSVNQEISLPVFEYCIPEYTGVLGHAQRRLNSGEFDG